MIRFGRLTVISTEARNWKTYARCICDCGTEKVISLAHLKSGRTASCGCLLRETTKARATRHGGSRSGLLTPEYRAWSEMKRRCYTPTCNVFKHYGGRGITVCDRWRFGEGGVHGFECFLQDLGPKPSRRHSIERRDNEAGYEPGNVKWATRIEQARNTRVNRRVDICGPEVTLAEAVELWGAVSYGTVTQRLHRGWDVEDALVTPVRCSPSPQPVPF